MSQVPSYGVTAFSDYAGQPGGGKAEQLRVQGFCVLDAGLSPQALDDLADAFDQAAVAYRAFIAGAYAPNDAERVDPHVVRAMLHWHAAFMELTFVPSLATLLGQVLGNYYILNQQNGIINPAHEAYSQSRWHRDFPYQHFVSSRPLGVNALFCIDAFTLENGATHAVAGSHRTEWFPSEEGLDLCETQVTAPRGSFIVLDAMTYHRGGENRSQTNRRAVNHVFTLPLIKQQIALPPLLGSAMPADQTRRRVLGEGLDEPPDIVAYVSRQLAKQGAR